MIRHRASAVLAVVLGLSVSACGSPDATTGKLAGALASVRDGGIPAPLSRSAALDAADSNPFPGQKVDVQPESCLGVVLGTLAGTVGESDSLAGVRLDGVTMIAGRPASTADASAQLGRLRARAESCRVLTLTPTGGAPATATFTISDAGVAGGVLVTVTAQTPGARTVRLAEGMVGPVVVVVSSNSGDDVLLSRRWAETAKAVADAQIG